MKKRKDAKRVKGLDSMHVIMPFIMPHRTLNEAVCNIDVDLEIPRKFIEKKNATEPKYKYTIFHLIVAALSRTISERPKMNWFIEGGRYWERNEISFSFVAKQRFEDEAHEAILIIRYEKDSDISPIEQIHDKISSKVYEVKHEKSKDGTTDVMDFLKKLPLAFLRFFGWSLRRLNYRGKYPVSLAKVDPDFSTVFISNLGSIDMVADYHHLAEHGTNSFFAVVNKYKKTIVFDENNNQEIREVIPFGFTIDERIADGLYFANSLKLFKYYMYHPELLEEPANKEVPNEI